LTSTVLYAADEHEGTYCCINCRTYMKRIEFALMKKWVMPASCKCEIEKREQEEAEQERLLRRNRMKRAFAKSMMNEKLKAASLENFVDRQGSESCSRAARDFVRRFSEMEEGLFFYGKPGNGKSHLLAAIHHQLDREGHVCLFLDCSQLFNLAKDTMNKNSKVTLTEIINSAIECDLLTLDEIGSGHLTEYEYNDILIPIINGRQGKKTNYTTNLDLIRLTQWFAKDKFKNDLDTDGRLIDRIIGSCDIFENVASSKRQEDAMRRMNIN